MNNETYLRMLILLLPFLDFNFFNKTNFNRKELEENILLSIKYHGQFNDIDEIKNIIQYSSPTDMQTLLRLQFYRFCCCRQYYRLYKNPSF